MRALAVALAALLLLSGWRVTVPLVGHPVMVSLPALAVTAELVVCGLLGWLIARSAGFRSAPFLRRVA